MNKEKVAYLFTAFLLSAYTGVVSLMTELIGALETWISMTIVVVVMVILIMVSGGE